jgi:hypothetical protein
MEKKLDGQKYRAGKLHAARDKEKRGDSKEDFPDHLGETSGWGTFPTGRISLHHNHSSSRLDTMSSSSLWLFQN